MFTQSVFNNYLGITAQTDIDYVELLLDVIEEYLQGRGVVINTDDTSATHEVWLEKGVSYSTIYTPYFYEITSITAKDHQDSSYSNVLTTDDYRLLTHILSPNPTFAIELVNDLCYPKYVEIVGKKGFASTTPNSIILAVNNLLAKLLAARTKHLQELDSGHTVKKTKMRDVEVEFDISQPAQYIQNDIEFNAVVDKYKQLTL